MLLRVPSEKVLDQSICRTKEQKARLQYLAGIFLCQIFENWHFFEMVGINIFGLAYLPNLAYFSTTSLFA